jgi:hypothetical protein
MKKMTLWILIFCLMSPSLILAKRGPKPEIQPIIYEGIEYRVEYSKHNIAILQKDHKDKRGSWVTRAEVMAIYATSQKEQWRETIYQNPYDLNLEDDVQWLFVKKMRLEHHKGWSAIIATDENGQDHEVVIKGEKYGSLNQKGIQINYEVHRDGGRYYFINEREGGREFEEFKTQIDNNISHLTLIPDRKFVWTEAFIEERNKMIEIARKNKYVLEIKKMCSDCSCNDGMTSTIYDYQDQNVLIKTSKTQYKKGEEVAFTVSSSADYAKYFQVASAQHLKDGQWQEVIWNAPCGCGSLCDYVGYVEPNKEYTTKWDQTIFDKKMGCVTAPPGRYRFYIFELYGDPDESGCTSYHSAIYSNEFEIVEK